MAQPCCGGKLNIAPVPAVLMETPEDGQRRGHQPENLGATEPVFEEEWAT